MGDLKREIETRYAAICSQVDEAAGSDREDDALRAAFAELAAMMIAYQYREGARDALQAALSRDQGRNANRTSLAERARALIDANR
ncbi:hypothetical protein [Martelella soudanensis]|uniref:hypothetical protein n=1 Tax=unclassified Martelella TaxID=2629616 RepID=UPI0015DD9127|nr:MULTISPECIES: hypothetical protein [unclassified Martelella]